jgi:hypothetical protein
LSINNTENLLFQGRSGARFFCRKYLKIQNAMLVASKKARDNLLYGRSRASCLPIGRQSGLCGPRGAGNHEELQELTPFKPKE